MIGQIADRQHGVVARRQLLDAGVSAKAIRVRVEAGRLIPLHRGVYAVGHRRLRREGFWLAATLAVPGALLSHRDAAGLHGIRPANQAKVDVTTAGRATDHERIVVHRTRVLDARDVTTIAGIRATSLARTLVDLAGVVPRDHLTKALRRAEEQRVLDVREIEEALHRTRGRRGSGHAALGDALAEHRELGATLTRSSLEDAFQRLIRQHRLPKPETNVSIAEMQVDAVWRDARLVVELDGWEHHGVRRAFEADRERDARLAAAGWRVVRFTHRQVVGRPAYVADTIAALLAR